MAKEVRENKLFRPKRILPVNKREKINERTIEEDYYDDQSGC